MAPAHVGMNGVIVEVECDITNGLPSFVVVGLGNQAVNEARDRVRGAIRNSKLLVPPKRITLNLAPADLPKDGTSYDLSIAIAILLASEQLERAEDSLFIGELALDGSLRPVTGVLAHAQLAASSGIKNIFVPHQNAAEAALITGIKVFGAKNLLEIYGHLAGLQPLETKTPISVVNTTIDTSATDMSMIYGQSEARRALEIAAAGGHNILLTGPPGAGKTLLSRALIGILPPPSMSEILEITKLYSLAGKSTEGIATKRPFRNPHHTASSAALIGGGHIPRPGEISLSHRGVLFLDELPEFRRDVLEVLRQPLEDGTITISRARGSITFPAEFLLVAAQNPCPCGYAGDSIRDCTCSQSHIGRYLRKVSGPLLDRIDLVITVNRVDPAALRSRAQPESSLVVSKRVAKARAIQAKRNSGASLNSRLNGNALRTHSQLRPEAIELLHKAADSLGLSVRGYAKTIKVARTIADLDKTKAIYADHIAEALRYRTKS